MKRIKLFLSMLVSIVFISTAQPITILEKGQCFKPPAENMVVMDANTFGKYHYNASQCDTLKGEVKKLDSLIVKYDSIQQKLTQTYEESLCNKDQEISTYKSGYEQLKTTVETAAIQQNQLQVEYNKIEQKNRRIKRWRNIFMGSTGVLAGVIVLVITH